MLLAEPFPIAVQKFSFAQQMLVQLGLKTTFVYLAQPASSRAKKK